MPPLVNLSPGDSVCGRIWPTCPSGAAPGRSLGKYGFGDWDYYARHRQDLYHAVKALVLPTPGALGWGEIESLDRFWAIAEPQGFRFLSFAASGAQTGQLIADLGTRFERQIAAGHVFNPETNLTLTQDGQAYALGLCSLAQQQPRTDPMARSVGLSYRPSMALERVPAGFSPSIGND